MRIWCLLSGMLCLLSISRYTLIQNNFDQDKNANQEGTILRDDEKSAYVKAYTEFLLDADITQDHDFPIRGYYLFDLNFDDIPELSILHDSWGSMGGYFTLHYFDGNGITAILNDSGEPARISNYTRILADYEQKKIYLLKEMYLLRGNDTGKELLCRSAGGRFEESLK